MGRNVCVAEIESDRGREILPTFDQYKRIPTQEIRKTVPKRILIQRV